jgi:4-nitrophenyl phosphatase
MMKSYSGYLIDLDGTMYHGNQPIESAVAFVNRLQKQRIPYLFLTNNSAKPKRAVAAKLQWFGVPATEDHVLTSAVATAQVLNEKMPKAQVFMIGEEGLRHALKEKNMKLTNNYMETDAVVFGIDRSISYDKLASAGLAIRNGADFFATNADKVIPTETGFLPGNGSLAAVLAESTGVAPTFIGKPEPIIIRQALEVLGTKKEETLLIGDNYETDIMAGIQAELDTLLVHTGVTTENALKGVHPLPMYRTASLADWPPHP